MATRWKFSLRQHKKPKYIVVKCSNNFEGKNKFVRHWKKLNTRIPKWVRETLVRRFKNWKNRSRWWQIIPFGKEKGFKTVSDFIRKLLTKNWTYTSCCEAYLELERKKHQPSHEIRSAARFTADVQTNKKPPARDDVLVIGRGFKNVDFKLSKCCHPIYGDDVFDSLSGGNKNSSNRLSQCTSDDLPLYRIVKARWSRQVSGSTSNHFAIVGRTTTLALLPT